MIRRVADERGAALRVHRAGRGIGTATRAARARLARAGHAAEPGAARLRRRARVAELRAGSHLACTEVTHEPRAARRAAAARHAGVQAGVARGARAARARARAAVAVEIAAATFHATADDAHLADADVPSAARDVCEAVLAGRCALARAVARERAAVGMCTAGCSGAAAARARLPRRLVARDDRHEHDARDEGDADHGNWYPATSDVAYSVCDDGAG